ncbi:hypothetical protein PGTUg99_017263 [Puccinia graminis f. sp. tritici]|uniref:Retrovirus-related Pol polyprotein from transposon TNT 1-94-like beta-barrel domain-containing protein n=2 Tax=Puccinia graminis f. sp. tritici TaxID=56615 RepID=A0A5B0QVK7_PUCGR|nr:hypothetical protein PGTUg99_017263 [Puccinia graminis f. sp. tritici]
MSKKSSTSKGKMTEQNQERSDSTLTSLSQLVPGELSEEQIIHNLKDLDLKFRSIQSGNHDTRNDIGRIDHKVIKLDLKIDGVVKAVNALADSISASREQPPHMIKRDETPRPVEPTTYSFNQKHFMKDPMSLHRSIHSTVEYLKFGGKNYTAWEQQINATLEFVFRREDFLSKSTNWLMIHDEQEPSVVILLRSTLEQNLLALVTSTRKPKDIFDKLEASCKRNDRQNKLELISQLNDFYHYERQNSNDELIGQFQKLYFDIKQKKISTEELFGLMLQSIVKPLINADENSFRNNLNHRLNTAATTPSLDKVCQQIAQVEGELQTGTSDNPILVNRLTHAGNQPKRNGKPDQNKSSTFGNKALANALAFKGTQPTSSQMAEKGSECNYCKIKGHWASTCRRLARDLQEGRLDVSQLATPPANPGTSSKPGPVRVRAIDTSAPNDDTVLIDSGASACVSGNSPFFTFERRLTNPVPVLLASRKSEMNLTGIGSLKIPTPSGTIRIKNVYHHPSIPYVILSLGMLTTYGLQPMFDKDCTMSLVHQR